RLISHALEGRTEAASIIRGHRLAQAAKCIILQVRNGKKTTQYVLAVVPGDRKVDIEKVNRLFCGTSAAFAPRKIAERLDRTVSGYMLPFSSHPELHLVVDPDLLVHEEVFFNAARLDCSVALATADYVLLARALVEPIATPSPADTSHGSFGDPGNHLAD